MIKHFDVRVLVDIIGLVQGLVLGTVLLAMNSKGKKDSFFLGLFVISFSLDFLPPLLDYLGYTEQYPRLNFLPLRLSDLLFPLLYIYVQEISILSTKKKSYWVLIPSLVVNLLIFGIFLLPTSERLLVVKHFNWMLGLKVSSEVFGLFVGFLIVRWVNIHFKALANQYTDTTYKTLKWVKIYTQIGIGFSISAPLVDYYLNSYSVAILLSTVNCILLYWVSLRGIMQNNIRTFYADFSTENSAFGTLVSDCKPMQSKKKDQDFSELARLVEELVLKNRLFTNPELTIMDLSTHLNFHPKQVSNIINTGFNVNFNTFINQFRVNEAILILDSGKAKILSIDGIGKEVGFKSKSSFYTSFKQMTGKTPSQYKALL
jgi:AraC-like DNA-binding protein